MSLIEQLPEQVSKRLASDGVSDKSLIAAAAVDLDQAGSYASEWLVVCDKMIRVFPAGQAEPRLSIELKHVRSPAVEGLVGGATLIAIVAGAPQEIVRFSAGRQAKIGRIARHLDEVLKYRENVAQGKEAKLPEPPAPDESERYCPACNLQLPEGTKVCPACVDKSKVLKRLLGYVKPYWRQVTMIWAFMCLGMVVSLGIPYMTKPLVDHVLVPVGEAAEMSARLTLLAWLIAGWAALYIVGRVIEAIQGRSTIKLAGQLSLDIRNQVYRHLQVMSLRYFDKRKIGSLVARVTQDTASLEGVISESVQTVVVNILLLIGIVSVLLVMNWKLTLLAMMPVPFVIVGTRFFVKRTGPLWARTWFARSRLYAITNDSLSGIRVVKAFARESSEISRFDGRSQEWYQANLDASRAWTMYWPVIWLTVQSGTWLVWYFGGRQVLGSEMTLGTLLMFSAYLDWFFGPVRQLSRIPDYLARGIVATERVFEVLDAEPDVKDAEQPVVIPRISGAVEFKEVVFSYEKHRPALKGISLSVKAGEMIGLVGHSGSGKSTTINLLCRLYEADSGQILIDGVDIKKIRQQDLRSQIGVVLQDTFLFNGSISDNISYARPDASRMDIIAAAKAANAHDFIVGKTDGYDTIVGERGQALSGGERQRIAIARAILHDPRILILDEATSSVDTETESQIQEAIRRLVKGRTTFAIAHRLSTLRNADRLVVLKGGEIAEVGTHQELLEKQGEFFRLVDVQQKMSQIVEIS